MQNNKPIAIIGAGIAGLSCALRLRSEGYAVEIIEKARAPGGRASTRRGDGWQCDHGAQYFTARDPDFLHAVVGWRDAGVVARWEPRLVAFDGQNFESKNGDESRFVGQPSMSALGRYLAENLPIRYQTRVSALGRAGSDWLLETVEHGVLPTGYSGVVLTLPAPQAATLLEEAYPPFADIAANHSMRGCWALMARYANDPALPFDAAFVNCGPLTWVARDSGKPGRPQAHVWALHAAAMENIGGESDGELGEIAEAMIEAFASLGAPRPDAWTLHRWRFALSAEALQMGSLWDSQEGIGLAGDWLLGGRVEGAWLSGRQVADVIIAQANAEA